MMWVNHDRPQNRLHITFRKGPLLIVRTEWLAENASIEIGHDGGPVAMIVHGYYTNPKWPLTEELVKKYALDEWVDDLKTIYNGFFNKAANLQFAGFRHEPKRL